VNVSPTVLPMALTDLKLRAAQPAAKPYHLSSVICMRGMLRTRHIQIPVKPILWRAILIERSFKQEDKSGLPTRIISRPSFVEVEIPRVSRRMSAIIIYALIAPLITGKEQIALHVISKEIVFARTS